MVNSRTPKIGSFNALRNYARNGLIGRLAVVILLHTSVTFFAVWSLYTNPSSGANADDLAAENSLILQTAREAALIVESGRQRKSSSVQRELRNLLLEVPRRLPDTRRQALYRVLPGQPEPGLEPIIHWEDDFGSRTRALERDRLAELNQVRALIDGPPGSVTRITDDEYEYTACYAIVGEATDGLNSGVRFVYSLTHESSPPVLGGKRFTLALVIVFAATGLMALLIVTLIQNKISRPLSDLQEGIKRLMASEEPGEEPELLNVCSSCSIGELMASFNEMSLRLHEQRRQLIQAHEEMNRAALELSASKGLLETTVECAPDAIIVASASGDIEYFNKAGRNLFGYGSDPAPTYVNDLFVQEALSAHKSLEEHEMKIERELLGVRADGEQFPALAISAPLRTPGDPLSGFVYLIRDISESEGYREMISRLDQLSVRGEMAGDIAHEINNFLAIVQGNVELLPSLIKTSNAEKIQRRLTAIISAVERITDFTKGLMSFEPRELTLSQEDPNQLIHNLLSFLKPQKRLRHVQIDLQLEKNVTAIPLDSGLIQQALVNLIYNSADALLDIEGEKQIIISSERGKTFRFAVSDNGPGIPERYRATLFADRFTTKRKGNGIGLITCARIAAAHHGEIWYETAEAGGARFVLELPLTQSASANWSTSPREFSGLP